MIEQNKIKINFNNSEKILPNIPSSFAELKELFHELFEEADKKINYKFKYNLNEEENKDFIIYSLISEKDFQKAIDDLNIMNNPKIYVIEDNDEVNIDTGILKNKSTVVSQYNNNNNEEEEDNLNDSINIKFESLKNNFAKVEEQLKEEKERNDSLKKQIEKLIDINNQKGQNQGIENEKLINELIKDKQELLKKNKNFLLENKRLKEEINNSKEKKTENINELIVKIATFEKENMDLQTNNKNLNEEIIELNKNKSNILFFFIFFY